MDSIVYKGEGECEFEDRPKPTLDAPDEVLLKVEKASICGSDLQILKVPQGHPATEGSILGHEYVGTVEEKGENVANVDVGNRVVIDPNLTCGECHYCRTGQENQCTNMTTLGIFIDGGFAEYNVAPAEAVYPISKEVPLNQAVLVEPLSCALSGVEKVLPEPGNDVLILGAGPLGLLFTKIFDEMGTGNLIVSEISDYRSEIAKKVGADLVVDPTEENLGEIVESVMDGGADITVDAVGTLINDATNSTKPRGKVLLFGMNEAASQEIKQYKVTRRELKVYGTYISDYKFPQTVKILETGVLSGLENLVTHEFPLKNFEKGLALLRDQKAVKVVMNP